LMLLMGHAQIQTTLIYVQLTSGRVSAVRTGRGTAHPAPAAFVVMGSRRTPLQHPLAQPFQRAAESLTTALGESSVAEYLGTVHLFLTYLGTLHPQVRSLEQLHRDPHILG